MSVTTLTQPLPEKYFRLGGEHLWVPAVVIEGRDEEEVYELHLVPDQADLMMMTALLVETQPVQPLGVVAYWPESRATSLEDLEAEANRLLGVTGRV